MKMYHIFVSGIVQGVSFRSFTLVHALELGIKGWVRNTDDDKVEIVAECSESQLRKFLEKLKVGPRLAKVYDIKIEEEEPTGEFDSFEQG